MTLYQDLADRTEKLIADGVLRPGDRLPSVRQACKRHEVSPVTVTQAYHLLESRGLIEARPKSGYFVRARLGHRLPEPGMSRPVEGSTALQVSDFIFQILDSVRDPAIVPLGSSFPGPELYPLGKLGRFLAGAARRTTPLSTLTGLPPGNDELRRQIALRYLAQGAVVPPQEIVVTSGALEGINLCLQALTRPGDLIAVESPTFYAGLQASERLGLKVVEIPSHPREGVSLGALAEALSRHPVKACLFMLNFANPTGSRVSDENKRALLELLRRHQVPLIEDDVYAELHFGREAPLATKALDADGLVLHVSSFSKCLAPGYRVGWVAAGRHAKEIQRQKLSTSLATAIPLQIALADYMKHGGFDSHLRQLRCQLARQEATLVAGIERHFPAGIRLARPEGGYFLWLELPARVDALRLHQDALAQGISIAPGPIFSAKREFRHYLRLNFGHPATSRQDDALAALGSLIARHGAASG
ncbi:PLP-dependent aminotransferase family protein [Thauera linaloolentis]|uniref:GntR family transcriptional regulator n=1 Tax=Thauera linaloolentis (strain DSM 12138 / JCM 21573 / CCUG 41526 / CIP 105981 / IAM 15112 / NBRC 102519 / 47Lol) TaxID=1123367 RepID=N6Z4F3_THAL4|nr:PLP-dependent aminotransferase family protein [Thauera linaloolentis]ENO87024.1 GntR family transcriptional regulator [Thauera linaloolentis 47Lol = DSM 12138]MCM8565802.1 PLP-dependent aminotransferase family protein [Thauera linaloolentis]